MKERYLPEGWFKTTLGSIADWGSGGTPSRKEPNYYDGNVPWVKTGDLGPRVLKESSESISELAVQNSSAKFFPKGSVAIAMYGATIGKTSILGIDATTNQACGVGNPIKGLTFSEFLYYFLLSEKDNFIAKGKGGAQPNISQSLIKEHEVSLPPLAEQNVIADKLDSLLAQVETTKAHLERIPEILKAFRQSVLAAAVSGKLTVEWREKVNPASTKKLYETSIDAHKSLLGKKYKPPEEVDIRNLKKIPQNWIYGVASHLVNPGDEIVYGIVQPGKKLEKGVPYVRGTDIQNGKILVEQLLKTSPEIAKKYERASLKENDILLGIIRATKVAVVPKLLEGANITQGTARFRANSSVIGHEYLALYLESPDVQAWLHSNYRGIDMPGLNLKDVRRLPVALPSIKEQTEIVRRVDKLFAFAASIEQNANTAYERVNNLTQSVLAKAFRGELTAKWREQNPQLISGENSAEALLERIKVERKAQKPLKKSSTRKKS